MADHASPQQTVEEYNEAKAKRDIAARPWKRGDIVRIEHDGFVGTLLDPYTTLDGKRGWTVQLLHARVVHVYGEKWLVRQEGLHNG